MLPKRQLQEFYRRSTQHFGPDVLSGLDGEMLLETMHAHGNQDSLVYWLEFKNDDEFPAKFGSIAGGSAYKFGLYLRKETQTWTSGSPLHPIELSVEEAVEHAMRHRDQLVRGCEILAKLPSEGGVRL